MCDCVYLNCRVCLAQPRGVYHDILQTTYLLVWMDTSYHRNLRRRRMYAVGAPIRRDNR